MNIESVTPEKFAALRAQLTSTHQAEVTGDTQGTIAGHGVTANYCFDGARQTLSVEVIHHPFYIPVSAIELQLREAVTKS